MTFRQASMLLGLAATWGGSFIFIRVAVPAFGAFAMTGIRVAIAAIVLAAVAWLARSDVRPRRHIGWYVALGVVDAAVPFTLIAWAENHIDASLAAIMNSSTPMFAALIAWAWLGKPLTRAATGGLVLGSAGVAVVVGLAPQEADLTVVLACLAVLAASASYAIGAHWVNRSFTDDSTLGLSLLQLSAMGVVLLPAALVAAPPPDSAPPLKAALSLLALAVLGTSVAYLIYFRLVAELGATSASTVTLLVPVFGVIWGAIFLGESVTAGKLLGGAMVLASVGLVTGWRPWARPALAGARDPDRRADGQGRRAVAEGEDDARRR